MTRALVAIDASDVAAVTVALKTALDADGPAILPVSVPEGASVPEVPEGTERVPQRTAVVIETSGSTGRPKRVALSAEALLSSAAASDSALGGPGQWLLALPLTYIAGINVLVRSLAAQTEAIHLAGEHFSTEHFISACDRFEHPRRFVSLVPAQLSRLMKADAALEPLRRFDRILVGGQATPPHLIEKALELGLSVTRTYGSSETSGGCVYDGQPIGTTLVQVVEGRIEIAGSVLADGYLGDDRRTARAFRERDGHRWYLTDDTGEIVDGIVRVTGRVDDVIVTGGIKVSLASVEAAVRALPHLGEAVVVAVPHPEWGETPVVVSAVGMPLESLRDAVAATLGRPAAPTRLLLVDELPLLSNGKPDRVRIAALALSASGE